jgi:hypothetical protein
MRVEHLPYRFAPRRQGHPGKKEGSDRGDHHQECVAETTITAIDTNERALDMSGVQCDDMQFTGLIGVAAGS